MQYSLSHSLRSRSLLDADVAAFAAESGATNLSGLNTLARYVKAEGLWDNFVIYPMMANMNAGSGSTVYGLGGLTTNDITLVNSPTWGTGGIDLNGSTQYGSLADNFIVDDTLTAFSRLKLSLASPDFRETILAQYYGAFDNRSWYLVVEGTEAGDPLRIARSADGTVPNTAFYNTTDAVHTTDDQTVSAQFVDGGGQSVWQNKTPRTLSLVSGSAQTSLFNSAQPIGMGAQNLPSTPASFGSATRIADAYVVGALTDTQRERITDLINALDPTLEPEVAAFVTESGATDVNALNDLVKYVKDEGLYNNFVVYPMKSAQNAGSGSTVYGIGGLTDNDMTLVNSPTWGAGGIDFDGTTQYGSVSDFIGSDTLTTFSRVTLDAVRPASDEYILAQYNFGAANQRSFTTINGSLRDIDLARSSDGTNSNFEIYGTTGTSLTTSDTCIVSQWVDGGGRSLWLDKSAEALALQTGSAQTSRFDSPSDLTSMCGLSNGTPALHCAGVKACDAIIMGTLTTTQRETITDLINAL